MIEKKILQMMVDRYKIKHFIQSYLGKVGISDIRILKTPFGERIIIKTSKPGLVVGRSGSNIANLTRILKKQFKLENPQIEIEEVENPYLDAKIVAENIATYFERRGTVRFKGIAHRTIQNVMKAGARGVEIIISGKVPSQRAKSWRFYTGYMKKSGYAAIYQVRKAKTFALLKSGVVGIKVAILTKDVVLPDDIKIKEDFEIKEESRDLSDKEMKSLEKEARDAEAQSKEVKE